MASPPVSPARDLGGASRTSGGILRGRALGNVFNLTDTDSPTIVEPRTGKVNIYESFVDPTTSNPDFVLKTNVVPQLTPILKVLGRKYSPVRSKYYILFVLLYLSISLDDNPRIFVYEDEAWIIKGRYKDVLEDDDIATWSFDKGQDVMSLLIVSIS